MTTGRHLGTAELERGLGNILESPDDSGELQLIVRQPAVDQRESITAGHLDVERGLVGDNSLARGNSRTADGSADAEMQLNIMNTRVVALVADDPGRRELAGDQLYLDLNLSGENLSPGTQLAIGDAIIEVTAPPTRAARNLRIDSAGMQWCSSTRAWARNSTFVALTRE